MYKIHRKCMRKVLFKKLASSNIALTFGCDSFPATKRESSLFSSFTVKHSIYNTMQQVKMACFFSTYK